MELGIFAKTFKRRNASDVLDAVEDSGFTAVQFNMACAGLPSIPNYIPDELPGEIKHLFSERKLKMSALSGTFNMIHPDKVIRENGLLSFQMLLRKCRAMGTNTITICTGTRNESDMWAYHPDNEKPEAWRNLCNSLERILAFAEDEKIFIGVEPELGNVINSAKKAKQLIAEMQSKNIKIIFDPANLFERAPQKEIENSIAEGIDLLAEHIIMAHAKDRLADGNFAAAGFGILPYPFFLKRLKNIGFRGALITHGLEENQVSQCYQFLKQQLSVL